MGPVIGFELGRLRQSADSEDIDAQDGWELWYKLYARFGPLVLMCPLSIIDNIAAHCRNEHRLLTARSRILIN